MNGATYDRVANERFQSNFSRVAEMVSEFFREAAVLVAVFAPLDKVLQAQPLTLRFMLVTIGTATALFVLGVVLEVKRR